MRFFQRLEHVTALMSEHADGPMGSSTNSGERGEFALNRAKFLGAHGIGSEDLIMAGLVHGTAIRVAFAGRGRVADTDGLVTYGPPVGFGVEDCFPVFFAPIDASDGLNLAAIVHAGWPGILGGIVPTMVDRLIARGVEHRSNLAVAVGPGIRSCCFIVRDDERGIGQYRDRGYGSFAQEIEPDEDGRRWRVDLLGIILQQLERIGVRTIESDQALCTSCTRTEGGAPRFASWRRDRVPGANMLAVILPPSGRRVDTVML